MALCARNAHITVYDVTTWSWVNLVNPARGVRHGAPRHTRFRNPLDFTWISDFRMDFWISKWISGFLDFKVDFWISNSLVPGAEEERLVHTDALPVI